MFPVTAYPGDGENPPVRSNSGIGVREIASLVILHALLSNPKAIVDDAINDAISAADILLEILANK